MTAVATESGASVHGRLSGSDSSQGSPGQLDNADPSLEDALPELDALRLAAWYAISATRDAVYSRLATKLLDGAGLPVEWFEVLMRLYNSGSSQMRQADLESSVPVTASGMSRMLSRMESSDLITRSPTTIDRRALEVRLTPGGRDRMVRALPIYRQAIHESFGRHIDRDAAATISNVLRGPASQGSEEAEPEGSGAFLPFGESQFAIARGRIAVSDAVAVRNALEEVVLLEAAQHLSDETIKELRATVGEMAGLLEHPEDFFRTDWRLHRQLAHACPNVTLRSIYLSLLDVIESHLEFVVPSANLRDYLHRRLLIHARMVEAVASGDQDRIKAASAEHFFASDSQQVS